MAQMTGGEAAVSALLQHGVDRVFGLPGIQNDWLYNALYDVGNRIRVIHTRHEQGAAYMALGAALATGEMSLCNVVPGPGLLNASAALATAYGLNAPLFMLCGQVPLSQLGRGIGVLHEIPDQLAILNQFCKSAARAERPSDIPLRIHEAIAAQKSGRPGPVAVEVPMDVLAMREEVNVGPQARSARQPMLDESRIDQAAQMIGRSQNPMIFVGNGAQGSSHYVRELSESLQAPVVGYRTGRGILDSRHHLSCFLPEAKPLWGKCDLALILGTSARDALLKWGPNKERQVVRIDVDESTHQRYGELSLGITARLEDALPRLLDLLPKYNASRGSREAEMQLLHEDWRQRSAVLEPQISFLQVIREGLGEDGVFVDELTQVGFASRIVMPVYHPRTFISTGHMGTLGYGFPTALGVKVARPDVRVLSVTGDGGFLFGLSELASAVQHGISLVTLLFNNNQYGNVQQMQRDLYDGRIIASDLVNPDFSRLVSSFGAQYARADTPHALAPLLDQAFSAEVPTVIEVPVGDMPSVDRFR